MSEKVEEERSNSPAFLPDPVKGRRIPEMRYASVLFDLNEYLIESCRNISVRA